jgi:NADH-quinone oxidoreductase subunit C
MSDTTASAKALQFDAQRQRIVAQVQAALGDDLLDSMIKPGRDLWLRVATTAWRRAGLVMRDEVGCDYFGFISAMDWMPNPFGRSEDDALGPGLQPAALPLEHGVLGGATRFQVLARVVDTSTGVGVTLKVDVPDEDADGSGTVESWVSVYAGANWHERETHEMYGIGFAGHPDLRKLYLPSDFEGYPMRKDFPLLARIVKPWPGIVDVEPLPGEDAEDEESADG